MGAVTYRYVAECLAEALRTVCHVRAGKKRLWPLCNARRRCAPDLRRTATRIRPSSAMSNSSRSFVECQGIVSRGFNTTTDERNPLASGGTRRPAFRQEMVLRAPLLIRSVASCEMCYVSSESEGKACNAPSPCLSLPVLGRSLEPIPIQEEDARTKTQEQNRHTGRNTETCGEGG